jgi:acetyltransferase-like isoleucine patch superfamily enzyme
VTVSHHIPVNADFREVEDMQIGGRILLTNDMLLPNKIGVETGAIIEGMLPSCLSFDEKGKYGFKNIFVADEGVNILGEVECYGIIKPDLDFSNAESVVLNHVTSASKNMKLGKNVTCEGFVPEGLDFSNVENLVFKGVAYDGQGKNLPPVVLCHGEVSGDFSDFEKIILDAKTSSQGIIKFPKEVQFNKEVYGDLERVDTDHIILNNVYYMAASRVSSVDKVTCIGSVPYGIDLSKVGTLELKEHIKFGENVVVPSNVVLEDGVTLEGYLPNGLDLSKQSEVVIDGLNGLGENVKLPEKVIINKSILGDVDLSGVDTLVLRDVETMSEGVKLPKVVKIEGKNPFVGNDFHGVETVIVSDDMVMFYADKLPEHLIYHGSKCSISKNMGVKILETDAKSIGMIPDEVEKLILTEKEILWNSANVSCDVEFVDGLVLSGHSIYDLDLSEVKDLTLREFVLNDKIKLPSSFRVEDKSVITYELDLSDVEELTLAGSVKLEGGVKLPENVKFEDGIVLSGSIPDGLDLSNVKGLVFAEDVRIGEDVKLPDDVKFEDGVVISGDIPSNTDLSGVSNLTVGGYACFGENVRLPEDVKFKSSSGQCSLRGYIPKEADLTKVDLDKVCYSNATLRCDIPDGADLSDCSSLVFEGDVHFGKDVKLKYGTIEKCTNARFFGDVYATEKMLDADFSHANSLVISGSPSVISSDMKLPENNNVSIEDGFVLADSLEAINKIANCKIDDVLVGYMGNSLPEGSCISDKIPMLAFFDQETGTALIIADGENKEKAIDIVSSIGDGEISITHMTKEEFSSKTGVKFGSKEEKVDGILARVRGKLNDAKAADGTESGAVETSNQGKTGAISRDDFQM